MNLRVMIPRHQVGGIDAAIRVAIERKRIPRADIIYISATICLPTDEYQVDITYNTRTLCIGGPEDGNYTTHTGEIFMSCNVTYVRKNYCGCEAVYVPAVWEPEDVMRALIAVYGKRK